MSGGGRAGGVLCGVGRRRGGRLGSGRARDPAETGGDRMVRGDSGGDHDLPRRVAKRDSGCVRCVMHEIARRFPAPEMHGRSGEIRGEIEGEAEREIWGDRG